MRNKTKKWTMLLSAAAMTACLAVALPSVAASAEGETTETTYTEVQTAGFYMEKGAQVRLNATNPGIRFVTNVTKAFYDSVFDVYPEAASLQFYTEIDKYDNSDTGEAVEAISTVDFATEFATKDTVQYNGAITYENLSADQKAKAYAMELEGYAKCRVLDADGNVLTNEEGKSVIISATRVDNVRCMRAVASAATLDSKYETKYDDTEKGIITGYLGTINNSSDFYAYETVNESEDGLTCAMYGAFHTSYTTAYINNREVGTLVDGQVIFDKKKVDSLGLKLGDKGTLSVFSDANAVKTAEFMYVTDMIQTQTDFQIFAITKDRTENLTGYYILEKDLTLNKGAFNLDGVSGYEWHTRYDTAGGNVTSFDIGFAGTFDGRGYTLTSKVADRMGLWGYLRGGAAIKNVKIHLDPTSGTTTASGSAISNIKYQYSIIANTTADESQQVWLENVYVDFDFVVASTANYQLVYQCKKDLYMKNVIVENAGYDVTKIGGVFFGTTQFNNSPSTLDNRYENVYAIAGTADDPDTTDINEKTVPYIADWSAGNAANGIIAANDSKAETTAQGQFSTIYRYVTLADLYATFTESNPLPWSLVDGALVWNQ